MNYLRLFHFENRFGKTAYKNGRIYTSEKIGSNLVIPDEINDFFNNHALGVLDSGRNQNVRFKNSKVEFLNRTENIFNSLEDFEESSIGVAEKFSESLKRTPNKGFYLIMFTTRLRSDDCLAILTMEARKGVQVNDDEFDLLEEILPDKDSRLKKAAVVFKNQSFIFKKGNEKVIEEDEMPIPHAVLIDSRSNKGDSTISDYFIADFLDCLNVADNPIAVSKILLTTIPNTVFPFLEKGYGKKDVTKVIRTKFSTPQRSNFNSIINDLSYMISEDKLLKKNLDFDSLSQLAYEHAKKHNKTINKTFTAQAARVPKTIIKDKIDGKSINLSVTENSLKNRDVVIDKYTDEEHYILKVKKSRVNIDEQN